MKPLFAAIVYLVLALLMMWGILMTTRGSYALLITAVAAYALLLGKIGCLPKKTH